MKKVDTRYTTLHDHMDDNNNQGSKDGPVTVIVTRKARRRKIREFEGWIDGTSHEAMKFGGHRVKHKSPTRSIQCGIRHYLPL